MIYRPSRAQRRKAAGTPCTLCGLRLHHLDVVAAADEQTVRFAHETCLNRLVNTPATPEETE